MKTLIALLLTVAAVAAADRKPNPSNREDRPVLTAAAHRAEAERYEARAAEFAKQAAKHEASAAKIQARQGNNAMQHKWPGLANGPLHLARDRAMQARRAESESRQQAAYHREMAVKAGKQAP